MLYREWRATGYTVKTVWDLGFTVSWVLAGRKWDFLIKDPRLYYSRQKQEPDLSVCLHQFPMFPTSHEANPEEAGGRLHFRKTTLSLGGIITFIVNESKPTLLLREKLPHPSRLLPANTSLRDGPGSLAFLEYPAKMCRDTQGPEWLLLSRWTAKPLKIWIPWACQSLPLPKTADDVEKDISIT